MLCFLNRLDFIEIINGVLFEDMRCVKGQLVIEFGDYNIATMVYALDIIDEMIVLIIANKLDDLLQKKTPCEKKFNI